MKHISFIYYLLSPVMMSCTSTSSMDTTHYIRPYSENPAYWEYKGKPLLLLGATDNDNLFQSENVKEQIQMLVSIGGNYVRNVMNPRDSGNVYPFAQQADGRYDLDQWNEEYWQRFDNFLKLTHEKDVIVQIEVWDRFDYVQEYWQVSPFHPDNNVNYARSESGLAVDYPENPEEDRQPFFHSISNMSLYQSGLDVVRKYQERFVSKILDYSLQYDHVLYCMDNETTTPSTWGQHWIEFIHKQAAAHQVVVYTTDMFDNFFMPKACPQCQEAIQRPEIYSFLDISQINSRNTGQHHWDTLQWILQQRDQYTLRPVNNTKIYGAVAPTWSGFGTSEDGIERFCRDIIGGCAAARHHRPIAGNGLNEPAKASISAVRKLETHIKMWEVSPKMELLSEREVDEAYIAAKEGQQYALYFTQGGSVRLDLSQFNGAFTLHWINVASGEWGEEANIEGGKIVDIAAPDASGWLGAVVKK